MREAILGMDIRGLTVHEVWVERASDIAAEYYAAVVFDRGAKKPLVMLSSKGGMDVEEIADKHPEAIARLHIDPLVGFQPFHGRRLAFESGIDADVVRPIGTMLGKLYEVFVGSDATLVEVNPLIVTGDRDVVALDAKVSVDDNALGRQPEIAEMRNPSAEDPQEQMAKERGITYVKLDGDIGILGNGAGLVMSTLDVVAQAGGKPANFLDVGGGAKAEEIVTALEVLLSDKKVKAVLFNIFGGITRCDEVANGHPPGPGPDRREGPDRGAARRDERRGGARDPRRGGRPAAASRENDARSRRYGREVGEDEAVGSTAVGSSGRLNGDPRRQGHQARGSGA